MNNIGMWTLNNPCCRINVIAVSSTVSRQYEIAGSGHSPDKRTVAVLDREGNRSCDLQPLPEVLRRGRCSNQRLSGQSCARSFSRMAAIIGTHAPATRIAQFITPDRSASTCVDTTPEWHVGSLPTPIWTMPGVSALAIIRWADNIKSLKRRIFCRGLPTYP